jgi:glycosyltransferase involved in cell wall biosynthesis
MEGFMPRLYASLQNTIFVAVSQSTYDELVRLGAKQDKIRLVADGVDLSKYSPNRSSILNGKSCRPMVLFLSRLKRYKRPLDAVLAFNYVVDKVPSARLVIAGDGSFKSNLDRFIRAEGLGGRVEVKGRVGEAEKVRLLQEAWLLLQTSVKEGFCLTVLEANACGTPCVAYNVAGLRDSVRDGVTGLLVPDGDVEALAEAIIRVLSDDGLREELSRNALEWARSFSWDKTAEEFLKVVEGVVGGF